MTVAGPEERNRTTTRLAKDSVEPRSSASDAGCMGRGQPRNIQDSRRPMAGGVRRQNQAR